MIVYAAFRTVPDFSAGHAPLHSLHRTLDGAKEALYPEDRHRNKWRKSNYHDEVWIGPDGYGEIRVMEIQEN